MVRCVSFKDPQIMPANKHPVVFSVKHEWLHLGFLDIKKNETLIPLPSRKVTYIPPNGKKENHRLKHTLEPGDMWSFPGRYIENYGKHFVSGVQEASSLPHYMVDLSMAKLWRGVRAASIVERFVSENWWLEDEISFWDGPFSIANC